MSDTIINLADSQMNTVHKPKQALKIPKFREVNRSEEYLVVYVGSGICTSIVFALMLEAYSARTFRITSALNRMTERIVKLNQRL